MVGVGNNMHTESNVEFLKVYLYISYFSVETFEIVLKIDVKILVLSKVLSKSSATL